MTRETVLVIGASGTVGSALTQQLTARGYHVRATTSKHPHAPTKGGVESVHANLATGEGVTQAFAGVDRAFLMAPPGYADQYKLLAPLIEQAKRHGLKKVVLMTAMGANAVETSPFRRAEIALEQSGLPYNIIRPNWFMQNFNTFWIHGIRDQGKIQLPAGTAKTSFIDARDIAAVAAQLLTSDRFDNRDFDLTGPQALDHADVAREISKATGGKVVYEEIAPATLKQGLLSAGLPEDYVDFLVMIFGFLREGYNARTTDNVEHILGHAPGDFRSYVNAYKDAWARKAVG
jgi:uncharacterized protein YbjT (DUF2867 family)